MREGVKEREKRFHLKGFAIEMSTLKIHARFHCNLHRKICGRNAYDDSNYQKIIKADEGEAYAVRSLKFGVFSCFDLHALCKPGSTVDGFLLFLFSNLAEFWTYVTRKPNIEVISEYQI